MNIQQTAAVLAKIKLVDNREVDTAGLVLREWHNTIGHLDFDAAIAAVTLHRQESTEYLQPAHIVRLVHRVGESRLPPRHEITAAECTHVFKGGWCVHCPTREQPY